MSREVKLSVKAMRAAIARGKKGAEGLVKVVRSGKKAVQDVRKGIRRTKAEFREIAAQQAAQAKAEKAAEAEAKRAAKIARARDRAVQNQLYRDSRIDARRGYSAFGNLREKLPTLGRSLANPAGGLAAGIGVFGEGIFGIVGSNPFFSQAAGVIALMQPVLNKLDKLQKKRIQVEVENAIARNNDLIAADRFRNDPRFAVNATNRAIDEFLMVDSEYKRNGWVSEDFAEFEGF